MKKLLSLISILFVMSSGLFASGGSSTPPLQGSHPFVLVHGILGFDDKNPPASILRYWGGMDEYLKSQGAKVISPGSTAAASIATRANQTAPQIINFMNSVGASKVHLLGHSQGGILVRYLAKVTPSLQGKISTVTTLNAVHRGTPVADIALGVIPNWLEPFVGTIVNFFLGLIYSDNQQDVIAMTTSLTTKTLASYNQTVTNNPSVKYYSYGSKMTMVDFIQHPLMSIPHPICWTGGVFNGQGGENDGVVPLSSQKWGTWKGGPSYGLFVTGVDHLQATNFEWGGQTWYDVNAYFLNMATNAKNNQ
ncbi:MAG: lipase [Leptospiraceae bacterium]|nr:lipase [Leptospiraceae bacterium]